MKNILTSLSPTKILQKTVLLFLWVTLSAIALHQIASAQTTKPTDGATPLGLQAGAPAGGYSLSGFDNVNLYNGSLSFALPLLSIGGRGGASHTIMLPIERKWWRRLLAEITHGPSPLTADPRRLSPAMGRE